MRSRDLRITSFIVVFPVALILLSLCTILCLAIASQIKSLYPSLFSAPREPAVDVYGSLSAVNPGLAATFPDSTGRRSFGTNLTLRSLLSSGFLLCAVLYLFVLACRLFHKLRTRHALDSCLERLAEYRIPGSMYINPKKVPRLSRWSPFSSSLFLAPSPTNPSPPRGTASWLLSRSGNGSLSLHSPENPHGTTTFVSALSSTLASSKPYYRFESSSSNHSSSSHLYIPEQQLQDHLLALEEFTSDSQSLDKSSSNISSVAHSPSTQDAPPIASTYEPMDTEETKPQQPQQLEPPQQNQVVNKESQPSNKKSKAKKRQQQQQQQQQQHMKPTKQQQHVVQKDLFVIPAPAAEPPLALQQQQQQQQKRTTNGVSSTKKKREQKRLRQTASKEPIQQQSQSFAQLQQRLPTPEPSPPEKPQHPKERKEAEKQLYKHPQQGQAKPTTQPQQNWYSPFSTGLEIDIMPRSPSMRRYTLFGDPLLPSGYHKTTASPTLNDEFAIGHDNNGQLGLPPYSGWPLQQRTGQVSPLSASPPSPPLGMPYSHRQFRPFWPGYPPQDTAFLPRPNRGSGSNGLRDPISGWPSQVDHPSSKPIPTHRALNRNGRSFGVEGGNRTHFSLFSNNDDHLCFH